MSLCRLRKHVRRNDLMEILDYRMGEAGGILLLFFVWDESSNDGGVGDSCSMSFLHGVRVGGRWEKPGKSQAIPTQCPCYMGDGWEKDGRRLEKPCKAHPMPMLHGERVGERWEKSALSHKKLDRKGFGPVLLLNIPFVGFWR